MTIGNPLQDHQLLIECSPRAEDFNPRRRHPLDRIGGRQLGASTSPKEDSVTFRRLAAIALIFLGTSIAWTVLGSSLVARSGEFDGRLEREVQLLWGGPHRQIAPNAWILRPGVETAGRGNEGPGGPRPSQGGEQDGASAGARSPRIDTRHRRPRPGTSAQGAAVVCHLHRHVQGDLHVPQPGRRGA